MSSAIPIRSELSSTPGGVNFYGTTPGGSRIVYSREQLLGLASSPLAKSPTKANIPPQISRFPQKHQQHQHQQAQPHEQDLDHQPKQHEQPALPAKDKDSDDQQFQMDL